MYNMYNCTAETFTKRAVQYWGQSSVVLSDSAGTVGSRVATLRVFHTHVYNSVFFPPRDATAPRGAKTS